jgi:hypothetical protein
MSRLNITLKYAAPALALMLALLPQHAAAAWQRVGGNANVVAYADPATIKRQGHLARMANLLDFAAAQSDRSVGKQPYLSQREEREYDCPNERYRLLKFSLRAGPMFSGAAVRGKSNDGEWSPMMPGSLGEVLWKTACAKK